MGSWDSLLLACLLGTALPVAQATDMNIYRKMPQLFGLDNYDGCMVNTNGSYCLVDIELTINKSSLADVFQFMKEYSSFRWRAYRHDIIHRGICNSSCEERLEDCALRDLRTQGWEGTIRKLVCLENYDKPIGLPHWLFLGIVVLIVIINIISSIYCANTNHDAPGRSWALGFSIQDNWRQLTSRSRQPGVQCLRLLTMVAVIGLHAFFGLAKSFLYDPYLFEKQYTYIHIQVLPNGTAVVHIFLCISSFFMTLQFLKHIEQKPKFNIWIFPYSIFQRWLRLAPVYALVLGFITTWYEQMGSGPLWMSTVGAEAASCRQAWWHNLLFIHNIMKTLSCVTQAWYLSVDFQLFCMCMCLLMLMWRFPSTAKPVLATALVTGVVLPGALTYYYSYPPIVDISPESIRSSFVDDRTFQNIYSQSYGNITGYILGMIAGYVQYYNEKKNVTLSQIKIKILMYFFLMLFVAYIFGSTYFYRDDYVYNRIIASIYASTYKPVFGFHICFLIITMVNDIPNFMRRCIEILPLEVLSKLSYCAFFLHSIIQISLIGLEKQPLDFSGYYFVHFVASSTFLSFLLAVPLYLLVEKPFSNLQKILFMEKNVLTPKTINDAI